MITQLNVFYKNIYILHLKISYIFKTFKIATDTKKNTFAIEF